MQRYENFVIAFVLALISGYWLNMTLSLPQSASTALYGPRFFPQLILGGLVICTLLFLWNGFQQRDTQRNVQAQSFLFHRLWKDKLLILLLLVVGYVFLFERIGFCLSSILYIVIAQLLFGIRNKVILFFVSPAVILALNALFVTVFKIPVP